MSWIRDPVIPVDADGVPGGQLGAEVDALTAEDYENEGLKACLVEKSRQMLCMLECQVIKQALGKEVLRTHNAFIPKYEAAETARDRVVREEFTKALATSRLSIA